MDEWMSTSSISKCPSVPLPNKIPSRCFNNMIHPLFRTTIFGILFYQGESDKSPQLAQKYACSLMALVEDWRERWSERSDTSPNFPFGIVQIPPFGKKEMTPSAICGNNEKCAAPGLLRWSQTAKYGYLPNPKLPNTFGATATDLGDPDGNFHHKNKKPLGERLANAALISIYGEKDELWLIKPLPPPPMHTLRNTIIGGDP